jgi:YD repeat-containing protein
LVCSSTLPITRPVGSWTQTYGYDNANRLLTVNEGTGGLAQAFDYDNRGNKWTTSGFEPYPGATPNAATAYTSLNRLVEDANLTYDAAGNLTKYLTYTLAYDAENRLFAVTSASTGSAKYEYDGDGRRVRKLVCSGVSPCTEATSGVKITTFVYDPEGQLAQEGDSLTRHLGRIGESAIRLWLFRRISPIWVLWQRFFRPTAVALFPTQAALPSARADA